jgi:proteasome lid subunit RPN8/RPN11
VLISRALLDELISHAREEAPNECCGVVAVDAGDPDSGEPRRALRAFRARNAHASPLKFEIEPRELLKLWTACEELGTMGAVYHSHTRTAPYPSQTDINYAAGSPGVEWIIVGLAGDRAPEVRSYLIDGGEVQEVGLQEIST